MTSPTHTSKKKEQPNNLQGNVRVEETASPDSLIANQLLTDSDPSYMQRESLDRLHPSQQQGVVREMGQRMGNRATQQLVSRQAEPSGSSPKSSSVKISQDSRAERGVVQRTSLREDSGGNFSAAIMMIKSTSDEIF